jgi:hypothetical protein
LSATPAALDDLTLTPVLQQGGVLLLSDPVAAGGVGGGLGAQLTWRQRYLLQVDALWLWGAGNALASRAAAGVQRDGSWSPAGWVTANVLWGDRLEQLDEQGRRPAAPSWAFGLRASLLRFAGRAGFVSALEPGVGIAPAGGLWLELSILQAGARW